MNAIEFLRSKGILDTSDYVAYTAVRPDKDEDEFIPIEQLLEEYAEMKVKNCNAPAVSGQSEERASEQFICPCCGSDKTYKTEAYHCNRCAVTTEV